MRRKCVIALLCLCLSAQASVASVLNSGTHTTDNVSTNDQLEPQTASPSEPATAETVVTDSTDGEWSGKPGVTDPVTWFYIAYITKEVTGDLFWYFVDHWGGECQRL